MGILLIIANAANLSFTTKTRNDGSDQERPVAHLRLQQGLIARMVIKREPSRYFSHRRQEAYKPKGFNGIPMLWITDCRHGRLCTTLSTIISKMWRTTQHNLGYQTCRIVTVSRMNTA